MLMNGRAEDEDDQVRDKPKATWRKARLPALAPSTTAEEALADIVIACVEHLRGNEGCVLAREHEEGIHQMRVATRRLRSCLALYDKFIPAEQLDYINGELKWLIGELGPARDWDVFVTDIFAPVAKQIEDEDRLTALRDQIERQRDEAYGRAQAAVGSQRYLGLVLLSNSWAEGRGWRDGASGERSELQAGAAEIAHELLRRIYEELLAAGNDFEHLDPEHRHKVRIQLKKLRYATEFFSSLYPRRRVTPYLAAMKTLQDDLGTSNDVDVARKLLKRVLKSTRGKERAQLSYAAGLVVGWHSHVGNDREQELIRAWSRFVARAPYWETGVAEGRVSAPSAADTDQAPRGSAANDAVGPPAEGVQGATALDVPRRGVPGVPRRRIARRPQQV
jgi:CHAD domain-containing protein